MKQPEQIHKFIPKIGKKIWSTKSSSTNENRLETLQKIQQVLVANQIKPVLAEYEFMLILDEAITNGMEHGNNWDEAKSIYIEIRLIEQNLLIYIKDEGKGFDISQAAERMSQKFHFSPRGRGIFIISKFCEVQWNKTGNEICMRIHIQ